MRSFCPDGAAVAPPAIMPRAVHDLARRQGGWGCTRCGLAVPPKRRAAAARAQCARFSRECAHLLWTIFRTPFQWPRKPSEDGLESVLDGPCKKISGFGGPNGLQNGIQNGSRNGSRAIPDPNTYKRRKHYYSNAKWLWVPLLIHRFSLKIQPKLVPKLVPKQVPFRNPGFFRFWRSEAVSRRFQTTL